MSKSSDFTERLITKLMDDSRRLLVTILLMNNVVNVTASIIAATLTASYLDYFPIEPWAVFLIMSVVLTFVLLVLTEITPKIIGAHLSVRFAAVAAPFLYVIYLLTGWLVKGIILSTSWLKVSLGDRSAMSGEDMKTLADVAHDHDVLEEKEREMITSLAGFSERTVREIMVARMDMVAIPDDADFNDVLAIVRESGHSRIPVYHESLDNISGILYAKDLIPFLQAGPMVTAFDLTKLVRQPLYIPEGKRIYDLLKEFQSQRMHIGIVADEYGGTAGLVTMDDVIGEIIGDYQEDQPAAEPLIRKTAAGQWYADGKIPIGELEAELESNLSLDGDFETLAGYLLNAIGAIPKEKATLRRDGFEFTIEQMDGRRIAGVRIAVLNG